MAKEILLGSIELTKFNKVFRKNFKAKDGTITPCICIPQDLNNIKEFPLKDDDGNVVEGISNRFGVELRIVVNEEKDRFGNDGFIAQKLTKEDYEAKKEDKEYLNSSQPIIGNFRKWTQSNPNAAGPDIPTVDSDSEDLPW